MSGRKFGCPRRHCRITGSTNDVARELAQSGAPSGTVVTAGSQSSGRGRRGRRWSAPAGTALLCSAILRQLGAEHRLLPLAVPLAVCDAVESLTPVDCSVKWPNDVWIDERKLAGVLIEAHPPEWAVIGIGLNISIADQDFPRDLRWPATSIGHGVTPASALDAVCDRLGAWVSAAEPDVVAEFRRRDALAEREVAWEGAGEAGSGTGIAEGVDGNGNLVVRSEAGQRLALGAGEVSLRAR